MCLRKCPKNFSEFSDELYRLLSCVVKWKAHSKVKSSKLKLN